MNIWHGVAFYQNKFIALLLIVLISRWQIPPIMCFIKENCCFVLVLMIMAPAVSVLHLQSDISIFKWTETSETYTVHRFKEPYLVQEWGGKCTIWQMWWFNVGVHTFSKNLGGHLKIAGTRRVTWSKFHTYDLSIWGRKLYYTWESKTDPVHAM